MQLASQDPAHSILEPAHPLPPEQIHTVVVGAGQAGLALGYHLRQRGVPFVILDASARVGDVWRDRWDSLRLFTPARYAQLPGMKFPAPSHSFPTKDEFADYLEAYTRRFALPVRLGVHVQSVERDGDRYVVRAGDQTFIAQQVAAAMSSFQTPQVPTFARDLDPKIVQLHSTQYRNPSQLRPGGVLVVGGGNSGAEIAAEVARAGHETLISGRHPGHIPFDIRGRAARWVLAPLLFRGLFHRVFTTDTAIGRRMHSRRRQQGAPLIRVKPADLAAAGVRRVGRAVRASGGLPELEGGQLADVTNVIWCTGFRPGFSWIHLPVFDAKGNAAHNRGLSVTEPGFAFLGLPFLYAMSSEMIHGVARDAEYIADAFAARYREARR